MTIQEVASRYYQLASQGQWLDIVNELHDINATCHEPEQAASRGMLVPLLTKGREAIIAKNMGNRNMIETLHSEHCGEPTIASNYFSVALMRDVTYKGRPRLKFEEIGVYQVEEGKIIAEHFFY